MSKAWSLLVISVPHLSRSLPTKTWLNLVQFTRRVQMAPKNKRIKVINIEESYRAAMAQERSRVVFREAWVEFVIANVGD